VYGETGTGKGLLARAVHLASGRRDQQFLVVSCGALPETLVESELLGHVRGAFTGADLAREGLFVQADGGTLFLDEVGDLTVDMQKKLLRVLEEGEVRPLGAKSARRVDVRLICSAGEDLENLVRLGRFRRDLYFRLKGIVLHLAPLRERREDVLPLAEHFLELHTKETGKRRPELSREVKVRLLGHGWPGNVRELENEMRRVVALGKEPLGPGDLKLGPEKGSMALALADGGRTSLDEVVHFAERQAVLAALQRTAGNKSQAASELGITRKALYRRLAKYGIVP
jgi:DNA-binding NtrC family response regulator